MNKLTARKALKGCSTNMLEKVFIIAFLLFLSSASFGQVCGGGIKTLNFYTLNNLKANNLSYEMFSVTLKDTDLNDEIKFIDETFFPNGYNKEKKQFGFQTADIIPNKIAEEFLKTYEVDKYYNFLEDEWVESSSFKDEMANNMKGKIVDGIHSHKVSENFTPRYLMKVTSDNYPAIYILDQHFGHCDKTEFILLDGKKAEITKACRGRGGCEK